MTNTAAGRLSAAAAGDSRLVFAGSDDSAEDVEAEVGLENYPADLSETDPVVLDIFQRDTMAGQRASNEF